jgi:hypothetical protein
MDQNDILAAATIVAALLNAGRLPVAELGTGRQWGDVAKLVLDCASALANERSDREFMAQGRA